MSSFKKLLLAFLLAFPFAVNAQKVELKSADEITLNEEADYPKYNDYVVSIVNWLEATPVNSDEAKRKEANGFLVNWLTNAPHITLSINANVVKFNEVNPDLLILYMGGWARYVIKTGDTAGKKGSLAGIQTVLKAYKNPKNGYKKDPELDKLVALEKKSQLEAWANKQYADTSEQ